MSWVSIGRMNGLASRTNTNTAVACIALPPELQPHVCWLYICAAEAVTNDSVAQSVAQWVVLYNQHTQQRQKQRETEHHSWGVREECSAETIHAETMGSLFWCVSSLTPYFVRKPKSIPATAGYDSSTGGDTVRKHRSSDQQLLHAVVGWCDRRRGISGGKPGDTSITYRVF